MYIIGIDIGNNYHEASIVDAVGNPIGHSLRFSNTHKNANKLMAHIENTSPMNLVFSAWRLPVITGIPSIHF